MTKREGVPACEPVSEGWWCRLKERLDYLWDRASACILTVNHKTPDGDGDFSLVGGDGIRITDEDNGVRIDATLTEESIEGIVGQEAAAREAADAALGQRITAEATARQQADSELQADIGTRALQTALDAEASKRKNEDDLLRSVMDTKASQDALDAEASARNTKDLRLTDNLNAEKVARKQADDALSSGKLDKDQGTGNAGKVLIVGGDGIVKPGTSSASVAWGGISGDLADQTDLSDALGDKADNADVVHKSGAETIGGNKTFAANPQVSKLWPYISLKDPTYSADTSPDAWRRIGGLQFVDRDNKELGYVCMTDQPNGYVSYLINGTTILTNGKKISHNLGLVLNRDPSIAPFGLSPTIPGTSTDTEIVNAASLNQWPSIVRTVGNQVIEGIKRFKSTPEVPLPLQSAVGSEVVNAGWVRHHEIPRTYTAARLQQILTSGGALMGHLTVSSADKDYSGMISAVLDSGGVSYTGGILSDGSSVLVCLSLKIITGSSTASLMTLTGSRQSGSIVSLYGWAYNAAGMVVDP